MAATSPHDVGDEVNRQPLNQEALRWLKVANFPPTKPVALPARQGRPGPARLSARTST